MTAGGRTGPARRRPPDRGGAPFSARLLLQLAAGDGYIQPLQVSPACVLVLAPWVVRNWIVLDEPLLSTNSGSLLYGANCDAAYYSRLIGTWPCYPTPAESAGADGDVAARLRRTGSDYAGDHAGRLPAVVGVRVLRTWDLWRPFASAHLEAGIADRHLRAQQSGLVVYWLLLPLALAGAVLLRRRGQPLRLLIAPFVLVTLVGAVGYGSTRFRVPAEIPLVVLAACALAAVVDRGRRVA